MRGAALLLFLLASCGGEAPKHNQSVDLPEPSGPPVAQQADAVPSTAPDQRTAAWESVASDQGMALRFTAAGGKLLLSIACLGSPARLVATAPGFSPTASDDRLSLALGEEPVTLVADPRRQGSAGVTAEAPVPPQFDELLENAKQLSAHYGAQRIGPVPAPQDALKDALAASCTGRK